MEIKGSGQIGRSYLEREKDKEREEKLLFEKSQRPKMRKNELVRVVGKKSISSLSITGIASLVWENILDMELDRAYAYHRACAYLKKNGCSKEIIDKVICKVNEIYRREFTRDMKMRRYSTEEDLESKFSSYSSLDSYLWD